VFCVVVVSAAYGAAEVEACVEAFLQDFTAKLEVRVGIDPFSIVGWRHESICSAIGELTTPSFTYICNM
jgi:hypothetical protein